MNYFFKTCIVLFIVGLSTTSLVCQTPKDKKEQKQKSSTSTSDSKCFDESTHILNIGCGIGYSRYYSSYRNKGYRYRSSPSFNISYEQAYPKKVGPGFIGIGAYLGYQRSSSTYNYNNYFYNGYYGNYYYKNSWSNTIVAARAAYHLDELNTKDGEVYFGVMIGFRIQTYRYTTNNNYGDPYESNYNARSISINPSLSVFAGGRWYVAKNVALFGEVGYGITYLNGGLSIKF